MFKSKVSILILGLYLIAPSSFSADWYVIDKGAWGTMYVDRDSIERLKNSSVRLAYKFESKEDHYMRVNTILRCKDKAQTIQSFRIVSKDGVVNEGMDIKNDEQKTTPINGGYMQTIYDYACKK